MSQSIEIGQERTEEGITVYAIIMGERVALRKTPSGQTKQFVAGAEALATAIEHAYSKLDPEKVSELAIEAAREAGVDESTIAMGGVAVGPFGAMEIPGESTTDEEESC